MIGCLLAVAFAPWTVAGAVVRALAPSEAALRADPCVARLVAIAEAE